MWWLNIASAVWPLLFEGLLFLFQRCDSKKEFKNQLFRDRWVFLKHRHINQVFVCVERKLENCSFAGLQNILNNILYINENTDKWIKHCMHGLNRSGWTAKEKLDMKKMAGFDMTELHLITLTLSSRYESVTAQSGRTEFELKIISSPNEHSVCFQNFGYETLLCNV